MMPVLSVTDTICRDMIFAHSVIGITFTEKWNTDNMLATEVTVEDQLLKGLKLSFDTQFVPQTG